MFPRVNPCNLIQRDGNERPSIIKVNFIVIVRIIDAIAMELVQA